VYQIIEILSGFVRIVKQAICTSGAMISVAADQHFTWS